MFRFKSEVTGSEQVHCYGPYAKDYCPNVYFGRIAHNDLVSSFVGVSVVGQDFRSLSALSCEVLLCYCSLDALLLGGSPLHNRQTVE